MEQTKIERDILDAARELFIDRGFASTSTTDIARKVGCNQALIHYYYRTKENLFQKIFFDTVTNGLEVVNQSLDNDIPFEELLDRCLDMYFSFLKKNPKIPMFLMQELWMNSDRRVFIKNEFLSNPLRTAVYQKYCHRVEAAISTGQLNPIRPFDILITVVSLVASSFILAPIISDLIGDGENIENEFILNRKEEITRTLKLRLIPGYPID